jgi:hypothetical protein
VDGCVNPLDKPDIFVVDEQVNERAKLPLRRKDVLQQVGVACGQLFESVADGVSADL